MALGILVGEVLGLLGETLGDGVGAVVGENLLSGARCIAGDDQLGAYALQLGNLVGHREDAAYDYGRLGVDMGAGHEYLGEVLGHATGDVAMLTVAEGGELADASARCVTDGAQLVEELCAARGEFAVAVGLFEVFDGAVIFLVLEKPAAAVAAVVLDVERNVALGRRSELGQTVGGARVGEILATGLIRVGHGSIWLGCIYGGGGNA